MSAPLLNEYKLIFSLKRFFTTCTGAVLAPKSSRRIQWIFLFIQLLFFVPWGLSALVSVSVGSQNMCYGCIAPILIGGTYFSFIKVTFSILVTLGHALLNQRPIRSPSDKKSFLQDEIVLDKNHPWHASIQYLFKDSVQVPTFGFPLALFHAFLRGFVIALFTASISTFLVPSYLISLYSSESIGILVYILGWISCCMALFPLIRYFYILYASGYSPDPNTLLPFDTMGLDVYTRVFYIFIPLFLSWIQVISFF